jgi:hypothetical protein
MRRQLGHDAVQRSQLLGLQRPQRGGRFVQQALRLHRGIASAGGERHDLRPAVLGVGGAGEQAALLQVVHDQCCVRAVGAQARCELTHRQRLLGEGEQGLDAHEAHAQGGADLAAALVVEDQPAHGLPDAVCDFAHIAAGSG